MPHKNKEEFNAYQKVYQLKRYHKRRTEAINQLGGKCSLCDETISLEIDHINPADKSFPLGKLWSCSKIKFQAELTKCQLLCKPHHYQKSILDAGLLPAKNTNRHGSLSTYRYCKCLLCIEANNKHSRDYRRKQRADKKKL